MLLCRELSKLTDIRQTVEKRTRLQAPPDWDDFLEEIALRHTDDQIYRDLVRGPQSRKDRIDRTLKKTGESTDIHGAVLAAIRNTGPQEELSYNQLRDALRDILDELPQKEQTTNTLRHMSTIAHKKALDEHKRLKRDPVIEWQADRDTVFIADPFFRFRLRFGPPVL